MRRVIRYQVVRHRTRLKNEVHSILHAHLIPTALRIPFLSTLRRTRPLGPRRRCRSIGAGASFRGTF
jgi:hypothetical protein